MGSNPTLSAILRQGFGWQAILTTIMWYVYILKSKLDGQFYVRSTADLPVVSKSTGTANATTKNRRPLELKAYVAVKEEVTARALEKYLKSGSGMATLRKRILTSEVQRT